MQETNKSELQNRRFIIFIFLYTVFSGALRKWLITTKSFGNIIFAVQLLSPFIFLLSHNKYKVFKNKFFTTFLFYLLFCVFNPLNLTLGHGLLGLLIHAALWFILFFYVENRNTFQITLLIPLFITISIVEIFLGFIQYGLPADHFLNKYADLEAAGGFMANVGDAVRVCGTFSYIGGYTSFLLFFIFFIWALVKINYNAFITVTLLFLGLIACFMSGSRGITYTYVIFLGFLIIFEFKKQHFKNLVNGITLPVIILILIFLIKGKLGFENQLFHIFDNFNERRITNKESGEENQRIFWDWQQLIDFKGNYPFFGVGLGSTYQGAIAIFGTSDYVKEMGYLETENTRIVVEGGFILLILKFAISFYLVSLLSVSKQSKFFLVFFFIFLAGYVFNIYNTVFIFLGIALIDNVYYQLKENPNTKLNLWGRSI
jgi:hypothetical protein